MESWKTVVLSKRFWIDYFRLTGETNIKPYRELQDNIIFPVFENCRLALDIARDLSDISIGLYHPTFPEEKELAYLGEAYSHNVLFRWAEIEKIGDFFAGQYCDLPAGVPFLLLSIFAPVTIHDDLERVNYKAKLAWKSLGMFSEEEINKALHIFNPFEEIEWNKHPDFGWVTTGDLAYSFRVAGEESFPFSIFNDVMDYIIQNAK